MSYLYSHLPYTPYIYLNDFQPSSPIIERSQGREHRNRNCSRIHGGMLLTGLLLSCLTDVLTQPTTTCPAVVLSTVICAHPYQSIIKSRLGYRPILQLHLFQLTFSLPRYVWICVDNNLLSQILKVLTRIFKNIDTNFNNK